jgi:hypothetical protein
MAIGEPRTFVTTCCTDRVKGFSQVMIRGIPIPMLGVLSASRFGWPTGASGMRKVKP